MEQIINLLEKLQKRIEQNTILINNEILIDTGNKIRLYLKKYFADNSDEYLNLLNDVKFNTEFGREKDESIAKLKSIITTMLEDLELSKSDFSIVTEKEKNRIISELRKQTENERKKLEIEAEELRKYNSEMIEKREELAKLERDINEQRKRQEQILLSHEKKLADEKQQLLEQEKKLNEERELQQQKLLEQEGKFNAFKTKLEIADKNLDFQSNAVTNKKTAIVWAIIGLGFAIILIVLLCLNLSKSSTLIAITNSLNDGIKSGGSVSTETTEIAIFIGYFKYIISRLLLYTMIIYAVVFSVKNYNAQMHNHVINNHKANAFKSTLSLLNTARSDEGNDKLLIQATQAIFSHQQSGYSGKESEPSNPNLITNVVESIAKKI